MKEESIAIRISKKHYDKLREIKKKTGIPVKRQLEDLIDRK